MDGRIDGIIETAYDVSIGQQGQVKGFVKARSIALSGVLEGKVACERIDILAGGKLIGELVSGELTIEAGGKFIGESRELTEAGLIVSLPEDRQGQSQAAPLPETARESCYDAAQSGVMVMPESAKTDKVEKP